MQAIRFMRRYIARTLAGALFAGLFTLGIGTAMAAAVLEVQKTPDGGTVAAGAVATFTITVKNAGDEQSDFVRLIDLLPGINMMSWGFAPGAGTTLGQIGCGLDDNSDWSPNAAQEVLDCDMNPIPAGVTRTIIVSADTPLNSCLELTNTATAYYDDLVEPEDAATSPSASATGTITVTSDLCRPLFVIGDVENHAVGDVVNFWGAQWWKNNFMSGFVSNGVASFKGYATDADTFCGPEAMWVSRPGNSSKPPATIPDDVLVIVTDTVDKDGPDIAGTIKQILLVHSDGGYGPNPGHRGNGTVTQVVCAAQ